MKYDIKEEDLEKKACSILSKKIVSGSREKNQIWMLLIFILFLTIIKIILLKFKYNIVYIQIWFYQNNLINYIWIS